MELFNLIIHNTLSFVVVVSIIVFIHEFGHYFIAKISGVRIEIFSLGFGKELIGWTDKSGTRWKISVLPLGGYVKMFGDINAASAPDMDKIAQLTEADKKVAFHSKTLPIKTAVVAAGPFFNLISAILILAFLFSWYGKAFALPEIGKVIPGSPAEKAGITAGDTILSINDSIIKSFTDIQRIVSLHQGEPLRVTFLHRNEEVTKTITPTQSETKDAFGNKVKAGLIGITSPKVIFEKQPIATALVSGVTETWNISITMLKAVGQIITGKRGVEELGGPIKIAEYSGKSTSNGMQTLLWFIAMLSINLGLVNLFPIPALDGGHLMYYAIEATMGKKAATIAQHYSFRLGVILLFSLMAFTLYNDIRQLDILK